MLKKRSLFGRKLFDRVIRFFSMVAVLFSIGCVGWIIWVVIRNGIGVIDWGFLIEPTKPYGVPDSGIANALIGTLMMTGMAILLSVPAAILAGVYLAEYGKANRIGHWMRFAANVMMGMPSIIVGLFVYALLVIPTGHFSGFAGAAALAIIMFPVVMRTTEDMLGMVPDALREAALALGMPRWRATLTIICRAARSGLVTGILLSVARAAGETAPLLFTAMWSNSWPTGFFTNPTSSLPVLINEYTTNSPFAEQHAVGWGAALVITAIILVMNISCRYIFKEKQNG